MKENMCSNIQEDYFVDKGVAKKNACPFFKCLTKDYLHVDMKASVH